MGHFKILALMGLYLVASACYERQARSEKPQVVNGNLQVDSLVERGEYLVKIIGCTDCHTPKKITPEGLVPDGERYLMGHDASKPLPPVPDNVAVGQWILFNGESTAAIGPWGISYAGNLTPHGTGIGNWTLEQFSRAMREGKYKGLDNLRDLQPPMPTDPFKNLTDGDVEAIFYYLKSLKPIENVVPGYQPPTP